MSLATLPSLALLPPLNLLLLATVAALLRWRALLLLSLSLVWILALPAVSGALTLSLERGLNPWGPPPFTPQAIVILSGDQQEEWQSPSMRAYIPGPLTLEREAAGALLARRTGLPVLVSGGSISSKAPPLADQMAASMEQLFGIAPRWRDEASLDTWQNAVDSTSILQASGIHAIYLVTHAWHMKRALVAFRHSGLQVWPAPVIMDARPLRVGSFVPSVKALHESYYALHELIGWALYAIRA